MNVFDDEATMLAALDHTIDLSLRAQLERRIRDTVDGGLADLTTIIVVRAADDEARLADEIGGSLLVNPLDGRQWGEEGFAPAVDWIEARAGWWEVVQCVGNGGFAYVILVEERDDALGHMCRALVQSRQR